MGSGKTTPTFSGRKIPWSAQSDLEGILCTPLNRSRLVHGLIRAQWGGLWGLWSSGCKLRSALRCSLVQRNQSRATILFKRNGIASPTTRSSSSQGPFVDFAFSIIYEQSIGQLGPPLGRCWTQRTRNGTILLMLSWTVGHIDYRRTHCGDMYCFCDLLKKVLDDMAKKEKSDEI